MQTKLHGWASDDVSRRFDDLFNLVYDPAFLVHAWERVSSNAGARSAGVDRATVAWIESRVGVEEFLGQIRDSLKSGEFVPVEVRRVEMPKASGKVRKLGTPTVADRVAGSGPGASQGTTARSLGPPTVARHGPGEGRFSPRCAPRRDRHQRGVDDRTRRQVVLGV